MSRPSPGIGAGIGVAGAARRVAAKELVASLRDRQTLVYTVLLPLALYPAIFWAWIQGTLLVRGRAEALVPRVAVVEPAPDLAAELPAGWRAALEAEAGTAGGGIEVLPAPAEPLAPLRAGDVDLVLAFRPLADAGSEGNASPAAYLHHDSTHARGRIARRRVAERLEALRERTRAEAARERGVDAARLEPFEIVERNLASRRDMGGFLLSFLLPLTFVLMTTLGAFLPAVDLTAGERERRTLETTLTLPVPRAGLQLGKLLAVAVLALFAALLNLAGMSLAARGLLAQLPGESMSISIPGGALVALLPFAALFALFVSAVLVAAASTADTFRQGQSLLGSVQLVFILPAAVCIMPGIELTPALAPVPVVGLVLAFKSLLQPGPVPVLELSLVALSLALYAALALWLAARFLVSERAWIRPGRLRPTELLRGLLPRRRTA